MFDSSEILNDIYKKRDKNFLKKIKLIEENKNFAKCCKEISKNTLNLARMNLQEENFSLREKEKLISDIKNNIQKYDKLNPVKYDCKKCKDSGFVNGKICNCVRDMIKSKRIESLRGDLSLSSCNFENFDLRFYSDEPVGNFGHSFRDLMKKVLKFCFEYSRNFSLKSENLIFFGGNGLGKTHLALSIAVALIDKGFDVSYVSFSKELIETDVFRDRSFDKDKFFGCDLLIIDDLGTEFSTGFSVSFLYNILDTRLSMQKPSILVTNLSMKEIEKTYGSKVVSRIIGNFERVQFFGSDIRQEKLEIKNKG